MFASLRNAAAVRGARPPGTDHPRGSATRLSPRRAGQAGKAFIRVAAAKSHAGAGFALLVDRVGAVTTALRRYLSNSSTMTFQSSSELGSGGGRTTFSRPSPGRTDAAAAAGLAGAEAEAATRGTGGLVVGAGVLGEAEPALGEMGRAPETGGLLGAATGVALVR